MFETCVRAERPTVRKFYGRIPGERVLDPGFKVQIFTPGDAYFRIRIAEMFLRNRGELLRDFVPLAVVARKRKVEQVVTSMVQLADHYDALYQSGGERRVVLDQERMKAQLAALRATDGRTRPAPAALAEVVVEDSIDTLEHRLG